jgi:shikimate kinase
MAAKNETLVYLTGFMGSGKSTIAPILANTLGYDYADLDREIEAVTGRKVTELFSGEGEAYFRKTELDILTRLSGRSACVVSLGGGTVANEENLAVVASSGLLVYLQVDQEQLFHRLKFKNNRPMLWGEDGTLLADDELRARIRHLFATREPYYLRADIVIAAGANRVGVTVDQIVGALRRRAASQGRP